MSDFNLPQFINKFINQATPQIRGTSTENSQTLKSTEKAVEAGQAQTFKDSVKQGQNRSVLANTFQIQQAPVQQLRMNRMASLERSVYIKDLLNMPKSLNELVKVVQQALPQMAAQTAAKPLTNNFAQMFNLETVAALLQKNGKEAVNKLILAMSNAAKQGISDTSQIKETMKLINMSVAAAGEKNPTATLKALFLLYLPWLPLQEGVGFELEVEPKSGGEEGESVLTILISTKNFGNIKATLTLENPNKVDVMINCTDEFPKEELLKRLKAESSTCAAQTSVAFSVQVPIAKSQEQKTEAKVNLSATNEMNPYLLMMAHALIRHTIELDSEATVSQ